MGAHPPVVDLEGRSEHNFKTETSNTFCST